METVKVRDVNNGVVKEVKKSLAGDYIGTGRFELVTEKKEIKSNNFSSKPSEKKNI